MRDEGRARVGDGPPETATAITSAAISAASATPAGIANVGRRSRQRGRARACAADGAASRAGSAADDLVEQIGARRDAREIALHAGEVRLEIGIGPLDAHPLDRRLIVDEHPQTLEREPHPALDRSERDARACVAISDWLSPSK